MLRLTEDLAKQWLRENAVKVPRGAAAASGDEARKVAAAFSGGAVVKALVPTGRRGKAGAVVVAADAGEAAAAAAKLLDTVVNEHRVRAVYVEERVAIADEYYLSFVLSGEMPEVLLSRSGG